MKHLTSLLTSHLHLLCFIVVGHIYYFLMDIVPVEYGVVLLKTPSVLYQVWLVVYSKTVSKK